MPQLITFSGRPVKRRRRVPGGLLLTVYDVERRVAGEQLVVSDEDWRRFGRIEFFRAGTLPDVRVMASQVASKLPRSVCS